MRILPPNHRCLWLAGLASLAACGGGDGGGSGPQLTVVSPGAGVALPTGPVTLDVNWSGYGDAPDAALVLDGVSLDPADFSIAATGIDGVLLPTFAGPHRLELEVNGSAAATVDFLVAPSVPGGTGGVGTPAASPLDGSADLTELFPSFSANGFGFAVERIGDLDADGFDEWALGWRGASRVELRDGRDFSLRWFSNGDSGSEYGSALARIADLTGDGLPDVLVGAPGSDLPEANAGAVFVLDASDGSEWLRVNGFEAADGMGTDVVGLGDVTGDAIPDILGAARLAEPAGNKTGRAAVWSGADGSLVHQLDGDVAFLQLGTSAARLEDVDGDDIDDFVLGAWGDTTNGPSAGSARVYSGATGAELYRVLGDGTDDHLGVAVQGLGDIDGDGVGDFVVAATEVANGNLVDAGLVRFYSGVDGTPLFDFLGEHPTEFAGSALDRAGDHDGDGIDDLIVGAPFFQNQRGGSYVVSSATGESLVFVQGSSAVGFAGSDVAALGDLDGDGRTEWLSGAPSGGQLGGTDGSVLLHARPGVQLDTGASDDKLETWLWIQAPAEWAHSPWWLTDEAGDDWVPPLVGGDPSALAGVTLLDAGLLNAQGAAALELPPDLLLFAGGSQLRCYLAPGGLDPLVPSPG
ncbi:MAG: integrin alpha, partial [Planctomycetota bacterium]